MADKNEPYGFDSEEEMYEHDDAKAKQQGKVFAARFGLRKRVGKALAYKRLGYSASGVAKRVGVNKGTAKDYLDAVADRFGEEALWPYHADESNDPLTGRDAGGSTDLRSAANTGMDPHTDPLGHVERAEDGDE